MNRGVHILGMVFLTIALLIPSNGCGVNSSSSIKKLECHSSNLVHQVIPGTPNIRLRASRCDDYTFKSKQVAIVLHLFVSEYSRVFNVSELVLWDYLSGLEIEVSAIPKVVSSAFDVKGNPVQDVPVSGLAISPKKIWVEIKTSQIWTSSLVHELVHTIIWNKNAGIHADPDHEGDQFSGWTSKHTQFIRDLNRALLDKEI